MLFYSSSQKFEKRRCASADPYELKEKREMKSNMSRKVSNLNRNEENKQSSFSFRDMTPNTELEKNDTRKYMSVSEFNKFKNKFIERKANKFEPIKKNNLISVNQISKELSNHMNTEAKRKKYFNKLKARQKYLSESLTIRKLN